MMMTTRRKALARLRPPPKTNLADWMESEIRLPAAGNAVPGRIRLFSFQRGIADAISDDKITRVSVVKAARTGYTTLLIGMVASFIANDPSPILVVVPTEDDARTLTTGTLEPVFAESPAIAGLLSNPEPGRVNRNTMLSRRFAGGSLKVVSAKAPRNLRALTVRILAIDEADGMESGSEGSPIALAERRTQTFPNRKIIMGSTPVHEDTSHVLKAYATSDKRIFEIKCPHCGEWHEVRWADIHWPEGEPEKAYWACPSCGGIVEHEQKDALVAAGRWRITAPQVKGHAGFRLSALISPVENASWGELAAEYVKAKDDPTLMQVFVNTVLGEGWSHDGDGIDETALQARAEPFGIEMLPEPVLAITAGVDVGVDRVEVSFVGWDRADQAYVLGHSVIYGSPDDTETWRQVDDQLKLRFPHPYGGTLKIDAVAVDSGFAMEKVYSFCFPRTARRIYATKGDGGRRPAIQKSGSRARGGWLWIVGVDGLKTHLFGRLQRGTSVRFSDTLPASWYEQLVAERDVVRMVRGQPTHRFERIPGRRAEALDCVVYAFAIRQIVTVNWDAREEALRNPALDIPPTPRPRVIESVWMNGHS